MPILLLPFSNKHDKSHTLLQQKYSKTHRKSHEFSHPFSFVSFPPLNSHYTPLKLLLLLPKSPKTISLSIRTNPKSPRSHLFLFPTLPQTCFLSTHCAVCTSNIAIFPDSSPTTSFAWSFIIINIIICVICIFVRNKRTPILLTS